MAGRTFLYHGTSLDSALNIAQGIDLDYGKRCQDFSHYSGFYLNRIKVEACSMAKKPKTYENSIPAVVIYEEPENLHHYCCLDLSNNKNDWEDVIRYNRSGQSISLEVRNESLYRNYEKCSYIIGPTYQRTFNISRNNWTWTTSPAGFNNSYRQMCIKSVQLSIEFNRNLFDIICLENDEWVSVEFF